MTTEDSAVQGAAHSERPPIRVLVLDNYDSFAYNLVQYMGQLGADVHTVRNDRATVSELLEGTREQALLHLAIHIGN